MDLSRLQPLLDSARGLRLVCVGDLMLDRYVYGAAARLSPEAPIPVLDEQDQASMLGGVGNVARNVAALGGRADLVGLVGDDEAGAAARALVEAEVGLTARLQTEAGRRTTVKTRFVAQGQQLLRLDREEQRPPSTLANAALAEATAAAGRGAAAILVSDYAKGVVTPGLVAAARKTATAAGAPLIVDPKGHSFAKYGPVDLIKPNSKELALTVGAPCDSDDQVEAALAVALAGCEAKAILVTRAARGASLAVRGEPVRHFHGRALTVFDVSGAGDTTLAALGLAMAAGASLEDAVAFALIAAGVAVGKVGTASVTPAELVAAELAAHQGPIERKIVTAEQAASEAARWRAGGLKVGFTNGCFDILHRGHVAYLAEARAACDRLVVGVNTDASVRRLKGDGRPVNDLESRALVLAGLGSVDLVVAFDAPTPEALIAAVRPDVLMKGADYTEATVVGATLVRSYGGEVRLIALVEGYSTTAAIARMSGAAG